jgi:flagellar biosynthesis/type III secretory pathway chaperone
MYHLKRTNTTTRDRVNERRTVTFQTQRDLAKNAGGQIKLLIFALRTGNLKNSEIIDWKFCYRLKVLLLVC